MDGNKRGPRVPSTAHLEKRLSIEPFGGSILTLADIDGDGRQELIVLQSAGQFSSRIEPQSSDPINRDLYCLTAVNMEGEVLWQRGSPHDRPEVPYITHGGSKSLLVEDVDGDGRIEVLTVHAGHLVLYDGETGEEKASTNLPSDNYITLYTARFDRSSRGRQIICKVNNRAYPPWPYANPLMVLNSDLSCYAEPFAVRGAGHNMVVMDFDGDGLDELLIGYSLLDHELKEIWNMDFGEDFDYFGNHADSIGVGDINCDGELEILYSGSKDFFVTDLQGNELWKTTAGHSQLSHVGPWGDEGEIRIIMSEKNRGLWGMDAGGNILWNRTDLNGYVLHSVQWHLEGETSSWGLYRPQLKPFENPNFHNNPSWSRKLWPSLIDGNGNLYDVFPWKNSYSHPTMLIRAHRSYDCGLMYQSFPMDLNGDGIDEIVISDRRAVNIFSSPDSKGREESR